MARKALASCAALAALCVAALGVQSSGAVGVAQFCPAGDAASLIAAQVEFIGGLDPSPAAGLGTGPNAKVNASRFANLQTRLQAAAAALAAGDVAGASTELAAALGKSDGDTSPPDWLAGAEAAAFAEAIGCIETAIQTGGTIASMLYTLVAPDEFAGGSLGPQEIHAASIGTNGTLTTVGGLIQTGGDDLISRHVSPIAVSPDGRLVFVGHGGSNEVQVFDRLANGSLVSTAIANTPESPQAIVVHPVLPVIYVSQTGRPATDVGRVTVYAYSPEGLITELQTLETTLDLRGIALSGSGAFLVTAHIGFVVPPSLAVYSIDGTGLLSGPVGSANPAGASRISDVVVDPAGNVYALDLDEGIFAYSLSGTGTLTALNGGEPYPVGAYLADGVFAGGTLFALTTNPGAGPSQILAYPSGPLGLGTPTTTTVTDDLEHIAATADGLLLFASSRTVKRVRSFTVGPSTLTVTESPGSPLAILGPPGTSTGDLAVSQV